MRGIDKIAEVIARAEAAGRRIHAGRLVAPAAVKRVLVNRQQLEMGKAHPLHIGDKLIRQFAIAQPEVVVRMATPRAQMHFVDRDRRIKLVGFFAFLRLHHFFGQTADHRRRFRAHLRFKGIRVGFDTQMTVGIDHLVFVQLPLLCTGDKQLPDATLFAQAHRVTTAVPIVELSHYRNATCVRCPDGKTRAGHAVHGIRMCA